MKKLTLGIPTYNNKDALKLELESIFSQIEKDQRIADEIEILVSDNSDNDETKHIVGTFAHLVPCIVYIKNHENIGYDKNVDQVLTRATSHFCWTLSDNDPIIEGSIKKVLSVIDCDPHVAHILTGVDKRGHEVQLYKNMGEAISDHNYQIIGGLISQNIFNRHFLPANRSQYYGNLWFHLSVLLEAGAQNSIAIIPNMLQENADRTCRWAKNGATFITYVNLDSIVANLHTFGYSDEFLRIYHRNFIKGLPHQVVTGKLYGLKCNSQSLRMLYEHTRENRLVFIVCLYLLIIPAFVYKIAKKIWKKL